VFELSALDTINSQNGLQHAVLESLFCDAKCYPWEATRIGTTNQKGYWAKKVRKEHGSKLWLLKREKNLPKTESLLKVYTLNALGWVIESGGKVEITTERLVERINFKVVVYYNDLVVEVANAN
jgi:phage gp46-like protein